MASRTRTRSATNVSFREEQHIRQWWVWAIMLASGGVAGVALAMAEDEVAGIIVGAAVWLGVTTLLVFASLTVEVRSDGIHIRQFWLFRRHIPFDRIASFEARTYRPLREYLGWGVRYGPSGMAYSMGGNRGLQLLLADGSRVMIGSQRAEQLEAAVAAARDRRK